MLVKLARLIENQLRSEPEPEPESHSELTEVEPGVFKREALDGTNIDIRFGRDPNGVRVELP